MNLKSLLAVLAAAVTGFLLGWLMWGLLLADFFEANMTVYDGLMNTEPPMWGYMVGNLAWGTLFVYLFHLAKIRSFGKGYVAGMIVSFLVTLSFDLFIYTGMNLWTFQAMAADVLINALVVGGLMGGVAALVLGSGKNE